MSKYAPLWSHLAADGRPSQRLTFDELYDILGFDLDHEFLNSKREAAKYGYAIGKYSTKEHWVSFIQVPIPVTIDKADSDKAGSNKVTGD
ncbi:MAG: hypothetical protein LBV30_10895 [Propionibacteriaceae bacterium]|jgi:hypothetical protein|nr:hypothetical protein [Propionibacteriaceae bacterium]